MPDVTNQPAKRRRGMLGFYLAMGALLALTVGFAFAWTPLRVWYWERKLRVAAEGKSFQAVGKMDALWAMKSAEELVAIGPAAVPAVRRAMRLDGSLARDSIVFEIVKQRPEWAVRVLAEECEASKSAEQQLYYISALEGMTGMSFDPVILSPLQGEEARIEKFLAWWDREGKAKYGDAPK